jgi:hypothetical protein
MSPLTFTLVLFFTNAFGIGVLDTSPRGTKTKKLLLLPWYSVQLFPRIQWQAWLHHASVARREDLRDPIRSGIESRERKNHVERGAAFARALDPHDASM